MVTTPPDHGGPAELCTEDCFFVSPAWVQPTPPRQEHEGVDQKPGEQQQPDGQPRQGQRAARHLRHDALQRVVIDLVRRRITANPRLLGMARGRHAISRATYRWSGARRCGATGALHLVHRVEGRSMSQARPLFAGEPGWSCDRSTRAPLGSNRKGRCQLTTNGQHSDRLTLNGNYARRLSAVV